MSSTSRIRRSRGPGDGNDHRNCLEKTVVSAFNTWAFKREKPSDLELLNTFVKNAIETDSKIPFVLYWGKGPRTYACAPEFDCLSFLSSFAERVKRVYPPGAMIDLVFTDTHARLNGHSQKAMDSYFLDVARHADSGVFRAHRLSQCVKNVELPPDAVEQPSSEMLDELEKSAAKWFGGEATPRQAAANYFAMNMHERHAVEMAFPRSVFVTFNGSTFRTLFPKKLPIFYMYSIKKGVAVKPWFLPDPARSDEADVMPQQRSVAAA